MTLAEQYDKDKHEVADMFRESDAVDEVLNDLSMAGVDPELLEEIETMVHYNESLSSILRAIPDEIKEVIQ